MVWAREGGVWCVVWSRGLPASSLSRLPTAFSSTTLTFVSMLRPNQGVFMVMVKAGGVLMVRGGGVKMRRIVVRGEA